MKTLYIYRPFQAGKMQPFAICGYTQCTCYDYPCFQMMHIHNLVAEGAQATHSVFGIYICVWLCVCLCIGIDMVRHHWSHMKEMRWTGRYSSLISLNNSLTDNIPAFLRPSHAHMVLVESFPRWTEALDIKGEQRQMCANPQCVFAVSLLVWKSHQASVMGSLCVSGSSWFRHLGRSSSHRYFSRWMVL